MWNREQCYRLAVERKILEAKMPGCMFCNPTRDTYVLAVVWTPSYKLYRVKLTLPSNYPYEAPSLFVEYPSPLFSIDGTALGSKGASGQHHVLGYAPTVGTEICHSYAWSPDQNLFGVLLKAHLWCAAYDSHRETGKAICTFLTEGA